MANASHIFGKLFWFWPREIIDDWNYVAVGI
jgi:hypothetical protein